MSKSARKTTKSKDKKREQERRNEQRTLRLTEFVKRNLYAFVIEEGMKALDRMLEEDRERLCGAAYTKGEPGAPVRWGQTSGRMVMGGRRVVVRKPRVRADGKEVQLPAWEAFSDEDPLDERTLENLVVGVSTRKYDRSVEDVPEALGPHGASKSAASRRFVKMTKRQLDAWLHRDLSELSLVTVMLDALVVAEHTVVVALGVDGAGKKHPLGLWSGATENAQVCGALLDNLVERGLDAQQPYLFVIDGSKALRRAIQKRFGKRSLVQRCQEHKLRNVLGHLPKELHATVRRALRDAYRSGSQRTARRRLLQLVARFKDEHPHAAASLREGLEETLTIKGMNLPPGLERTLSTTNPIENLNRLIRDTIRRVTRWRNGAMVLRWVAAGIIEAERGFRRLRGHKAMPTLIAALKKHAEQTDRIDEEVEAA